MTTLQTTFTFLLLLPTCVLGFAPLSSSSLSPSSSIFKTKTIVKPAFAQGLYSSPFDDTPSALQEESDDLSPFDTYKLGESKKIVTKDEVLGNGDLIAEIEDVLTVALVGKVITTGNEFLNNENYTFQMGSGDTFPGFNEGLVGSSVGTKRLIKVPPNKAYGNNGAKGIPPMSDLLFTVEVKSVARAPVERIIAKIGTDRLAGFALLLVFFAISPFLPS